MISIDIKQNVGRNMEADLLKRIESGTEKALMALALQAQGKAQQSILRGSKTGRIYKRGAGTHRASAPGEAPANDLGFLAANIKVDMTGKFQSNVRSLAPYSVHLEYGTQKMAARPFLRPAGDAVKANAKQVFDAYISEALR